VSRREGNQQIRLCIETLNEIGSHLCEQPRERSDCGPIGPRIDKPIESEGAIGETCSAERRRIAGPGGGYTKAASSQRQHERDSEIVILSANAK
jgi:hypothetical protein